MPSRGAGARPGPPTLEEVAALAGLSRATVSRAVNGGLRVSPEAQQAVDDAVRRLGYTPNRAARSLVTRRTDSIAVVVPESSSMVFSDPFFAGTLHGVARALAPAELQMVLLIRQRDEDAERMVRYLRGGHTDGAVVVSHHRDDGVVEALARMDIPRVFIGRPWETQRRHAVRRRRQRRGSAARGRAAGGPWLPPDRHRHRAAGHERRARPPHRVARGRRRRRACPTTRSSSPTSPAPGGRRGARELAERFPDLDGLFVASDLMAAGAVAELAAAGRRVPDDVAVVGLRRLRDRAGRLPGPHHRGQPGDRDGGGGRRAAAGAAGAVRRADPADGGAVRRSHVFDAELVVRASA